jgi:hypothetical protein
MSGQQWVWWRIESLMVQGKPGKAAGPTGLCKNWPGGLLRGLRGNRQRGGGGVERRGWPGRARRPAGFQPIAE